MNHEIKHIEFLHQLTLYCLSKLVVVPQRYHSVVIGALQSIIKFSFYKEVNATS